MRKRVIIRLESSKPIEASWVILDGSDDVPSVIKSGSLEEAAAATVGAHIIVAIPGNDVLLTSVSIPTRNRRRILSAIPYALEDQLAEDVDDLHFAVGSRDKNGQINTAVVSRSLMEKWLERLAAVGIQPNLLVSDTLALPCRPLQWTLLLEDQSILLRTGEQSGFSIDPGNLPDLLSMMLDSTDEIKPEKIIVIDCRTNETSPLMLDESIDVEYITPNEPVITFMAEYADEGNYLDLLQGEFSRREQLSKYWRPWLPAAVLAGVILVINIAMMTVEHVQLKNQVVTLREQIGNVYLTTFPGSREPTPGAEKLFMDRKMASLRGGGGGDSGSFLALVSSVGKYFKDTPSLQFERVNYRAGQINVAITIQDLQKLDKLKQQLTEKANVNVEIQSATSRKGKVEARLQIKRKKI